jgi:hypothetical protein
MVIVAVGAPMQVPGYSPYMYLQHWGISTSKRQASARAAAVRMAGWEGSGALERITSAPGQRLIHARFSGDMLRSIFRASRGNANLKFFFPDWGGIST